ncbi:hypothetical protein ATCVNEJV2_537R [Acanthocystis turfacea Chlorella virus NE-JV-2]|uniref:Uncharacterized protein Z440R n=1 Tax=Chlorovirus heliozoae TaxID=322019 RepID=A7K950_9PHYC|nr:hypothetical protein ATCV1_Z440R [Acanthocystis turfacea chlorella virus 1]AGE55997.1 hypothetical protein ATCVMO0605SPH_503R [Acanthocystis turfacea Chlorella virus MO0605SPH]AGE56658.1 hypothetical protein ATCVNEJV2_537R [Acanthocystis turfacea Chlorella virus NE-JV-2]AGE56991.1 hypothetical protein ATCVNEJV3_508R [Acanthocystis turfacea Chlorella virus NE-JV-3]AGE60119.1 hypothetical protein ATCVWI0606_530R [Acanthocystis turfacea Chlorella virus WI0606]ABT16574.1 hypothetical protein AT
MSSTNIFSGMDTKDMLGLYSSLVGGNTPKEEEAELFRSLREEYNKTNPEKELGPEVLTSYQAFCIATNFEEAKDVRMNQTIDGFEDSTMEYTPWDPLIPVDDTQQYPGDECVPRPTTRHVPVVIPPREGEREHEDFENFYQGNDIEGLEEDLPDTSPFYEDAITVDDDQMPDGNNVSTSVCMSL